MRSRKNLKTKSKLKSALSLILMTGSQIPPTWCSQYMSCELIYRIQMTDKYVMRWISQSALHRPHTHSLLWLPRKHTCWCTRTYEETIINRRVKWCLISNWKYVLHSVGVWVNGGRDSKFSLLARATRVYSDRRSRWNINYALWCAEREATIGGCDEYNK